MDDDKRYQDAKRRARRIKRFYRHLIVYVVANTILFAIDITRSPEHLWFYWVALGWGLCLALRGLSVFQVGGLFGPEWEERKAKAIMQNEDGPKLTGTQLRNLCL